MCMPPICFLAIGSMSEAATMINSAYQKQETQKGAQHTHFQVQRRLNKTKRCVGGGT
jgi:hypothetical protein